MTISRAGDSPDAGSHGNVRLLRQVCPAAPPENLELVERVFSHRESLAGSRMRRGMPGRADLCGVLREVAQVTFCGTDVRFRLEIPDRPVPVAGRPGDWQRTFLYLFRKAVEADARSIRLRLEAGAGRNRLLMVEHDGRGCSQAYLDSLFHRGFAARRHGSGMGLAAVKAAVEGFGGRIRAYRKKPGPGLLYVLRLPAPVPERPRAGRRPGTDRSLLGV